MLNVVIMSPNQTLYQGPADSLSSVNKSGKFDILTHHSHFMSLISAYVIVHLSQGSDKKFNLDKGVLTCVDDKVKIYIGL